MRSGNVIAIFESGSVAHVKENAVALSLRSNNDRKISDDWTGWAASSFSISWGVSRKRWLQTMAADPLVPNNHREVVLIPVGPPYSFGVLLARLQTSQGPSGMDGRKSCGNPLKELWLRV
jgi:hypothetical protein